MNPKIKKKGRQSAQAMIEFALIFPLLIFLIYGLMEMGRLLFIYVSVVNASREASRYGASVGNAGAYRFSDCNGILNAARRNAILNTIDPGNMAISYDTGPGMTPYATACSTAIDNIVALGDRINVTVTITYSPLMPVDFATFPVSATSSRTIIRGVEVVGANVDLPGVPTVTFSADEPTPNPVSEDVGDITFQVLLDPATTDTVTVPLTVSGEAINGQDFTIDTTTVTFVPGDSSETVTITIIDDSLDEYDETFVVTMGTPINANKGTPNTYTVTITDNDDPPELFFAAAASSGDEGTTQSIAVSLSAVSGKDISFTYDFIEASSDASAGLDFDIGPSSPITIPAGTAGATLQAVLEADGLYENDELAVFQLLSVETDSIDPGTPTATIGSPNVHNLTIVNIDPPPLIAWELDEAVVSEELLGVVLALRLNTVSGLDVGVTISVDPPGPGDAVEGLGNDYVFTDGKSFTIPAGALEVEVPIEIFEGDGFEPDEDAVFRIATVSQATIGSPSVLTLTITEQNEPPTVQFVTSGQSVDESGLVGPARIYLSNAWDEDITINFSSTTGTATLNEDFENVTTNPVTIVAGRLSIDVRLDLIDDILDEADETIILNLTSAVDATGAVMIIDTPSTHVITILDNDDAPTIAFAQANSSYEEGTLNVGVSVVLSAASARTITVNFAVTGGTAVSGTDYNLLTFSPLTFVPGTTSQSILFELPDDDVYTGTRNVVLSLSGAVNATPVAPQSHDLSIIDNEVCPTVTNLVFNDDQISTIVALSTGATPTSIQEMTVTFDDSGTQVFHSVFLGTGGTSLIFSGGETASPVTITDGGTPGWTADGVRTLNGGEGKVLLLVFQDGISAADRSSYGIDILWSNGCTASKP